MQRTLHLTRSSMFHYAPLSPEHFWEGVQRLFGQPALRFRHGVLFMHNDFNSSAFSQVKVGQCQMARPKCHFVVSKCIHPTSVRRDGGSRILFCRSWTSLTWKKHHIFHAAQASQPKQTNDQKPRLIA